MEYKIEIFMTPRVPKYIGAPYAWCILGKKEEERAWLGYGCGATSTPQEAWERAYERYSDITSL